MNPNQITLPTPRINLSTCDDVRLEMSKVYREARQGRLAVSDATKLVFVLTQLLKAFELVEFEKRLNSLELVHK